MEQSFKQVARAEKDLEKYNRQVYKMVALPKRPRQILYDAISNAVIEYADNHKAVTYEQLNEVFGSPKELVETYIETSNYREMRKAYRRNKNIMQGLICVGIAIISLLSTWVIIDLQSKIAYRDGYYAETIYDFDHASVTPPTLGGVTGGDKIFILKK